MNGCFALRPSHGALSMNGVIPIFPNFDTPAVLGRDLEKFPMLMEAWYHQRKMPTSLKPPVVFVPRDFLSSINGEQLGLLNQFVEDFANEIDARVERTSIADCWAADAPTHDPDLNNYLMNVGVLRSFSHICSTEGVCTGHYSWLLLRSIYCFPRFPVHI